MSLFALVSAPVPRLRSALRPLPMALAVWALTIGVAPASGASALNRAINERVAAAKSAGPALGVHVVALPSGETVYEYRADDPRIPASNTKLFTTATALDRLGPGWQFETRVLARGEVSGGVLRGDLAVVGAGDPTISGRWHYGDPLAVFRAWGRRLAASGVRRVEGDLLLVDGRFEDGAVHPEWPPDQLQEWYEAPVGALTFNDNCLLLRVEPGAVAGAPARVERVPNVDVAGIRVEVTTSARRGERRIDVRRSPDGVVIVSGRIGPGAARWEDWVAVPDPTAWFGAALRAALLETGIAVSGDTVAAAALGAGAWREVAVHRSDLLTTVEVVNKRSQNLHAELLLKSLGAELCGAGTWPGGRRAVTEFLTEVGLEPTAYALSDGSGMSRENRFTPRQITLLLTHMARHRWSEEFMRSLPFSGEEGLRWERRLATGATRGNVAAKTGWLRAASALSGYAKGRSGQLFAFSILINDVREKWRADSAQDAIVRALVEGG